MLDAKQILRNYSYRYPFLLVDRITELEPAKKAVGIKNVSVKSRFSKGIFRTILLCRAC